MNNWTFSWNGLKTVVGLELRQRARSKRWIAALIAWMLFIGGITALIYFSIFQMATESGTKDPWGTVAPVSFGVITYFVLGMGLVIAPAFTATSINGDRNQSTLATIQATPLSALEIVLGKLIAAWGVAGIFMVAALPFIAISMIIGQNWAVSLWQVLVCFLVVCLEVAVVCGIGLGMSALFSRPAGSAVMTYLAVVALTIISALLLAFLSPFVTAMEPYRSYDQAWEEDTGESLTQVNPETGRTEPQCRWSSYESYTYHMERIWWVVAVNPFVIVADAAPLPPGASDDLGNYVSSSDDPLALLRAGVRSMAEYRPNTWDTCIDYYDYYDEYSLYQRHIAADGTVTITTKKDPNTVVYTSPVKEVPLQAGPPVWPWGLGFNILLGFFFFWLAVRRLSIPYKKLPKGTRVA
ncbi:MAG: ABC transporter permease [Propionibacteriaceae bacterium]|jgi:ABC-type transport system involved in multi-copper enzyme maturation permease subunit|nr:ABC transporter permease [Propionibacteriaceae bacterium]